MFLTPSDARQAHSGLLDLLGGSATGG
ncbi:hypothetical protein Q604_UNBC02305G0002, partial [human gut metagenome]